MNTKIISIPISNNKIMFLATLLIATMIFITTKLTIFFLIPLGVFLIQLNAPKLHLDILTDTGKTILWKNNSPQIATITKYTSIPFWLTQIVIQTEKKKFHALIFITSISLKKYKLLRAFLLCH